MSAVVERTKVVLQDGGKGRDDFSVLVSVRLGVFLLPELYSYTLVLDIVSEITINRIAVSYYKSHRGV